MAISSSLSYIYTDGKLEASNDDVNIIYWPGDGLCGFLINIAEDILAFILILLLEL
jgi:hypothetical protein